MQKILYARAPAAALIKRAQKIADELAGHKVAAPKGIKGRGIVTCGGGVTYFTNAWILIRMLRYLGCQLPIQLWYLGPREVSDQMKQLVARYDVECVDGTPMMPNNQIKNSNVKAGWVLKSVAISRSKFAEVMFLDADNVPVRDPSFLFDSPQYIKTGAIFWPDSSLFAHTSAWDVFRVPRKDEPEFESGQLVINKMRNWQAVSLMEQINRHADVFYRFVWGDKDTFRFAWHKANSVFAMPDFQPQALQAPGSEANMLCQLDFEGNRLFQHRMMYKWKLIGENPWVSGFFFENECRRFLKDLKTRWNGRCEANSTWAGQVDTSPIYRQLIKSTWLLESPQTRLTNGAVNKIIELGFAPNGTLTKLGCGGIAGGFWDISNSAKRVWLTLSAENGKRVQLSRAKVGWQGRWMGELFSGNTRVGSINGQTRMFRLEDIYPHLESRAAAHAGSVRAQKIRQYFRSTVRIIHSGNGIGDHIVGAYACAGLARMGVAVEFRTQHAAWLARIKEPNLIISSKSSRHFDHDLLYDYPQELRYATSRAQWYAGGIHRLLKPVTPQVDRLQKMNRLPFKRYVLLSPCATVSTREWLEIHWIRLTHLLRDAGYEVIAIGKANEEERLQRIFGKTQAYWATDHTPEWIIDAMLGAEAYIGIDNGLMHLAALMKVKAIAIHAQLRSEFLWPKGTIKSITPNAQCVFCNWQPDRGWLESCEKTCSALASVLPETVLEAVMHFSHYSAAEQIRTKPLAAAC